MRSSDKPAVATVEGDGPDRVVRVDPKTLTQLTREFGLATSRDDAMSPAWDEIGRILAEADLRRAKVDEEYNLTAGVRRHDVPRRPQTSAGRQDLHRRRRWVPSWRQVAGQKVPVT